VVTAIHFNEKAMGRSGEVSDKPTDNELSTESNSELGASELGPQELLGG
jgi:hypothetical protein